MENKTGIEIVDKQKELIEESIKDFLEMGSIKYLRNINIFDEEVVKVLNKKLKKPEIVHFSLFYKCYMLSSNLLAQELIKKENEIIYNKNDCILDMIEILINHPYEQKELYNSLTFKIKKTNNKRNISKKLLTILENKEKEEQSQNITIDDFILIKKMGSKTIIDLTKSENPYQEVLKPTPITLSTHNKIIRSSTTILPKTSSFRNSKEFNPTNLNFNENTTSSQKGKEYLPRKHYKSLSISKNKLKDLRLYNNI
ncbi:MAG TPA: hypothetical protein VLL98_02155 [Rickettsiales bacterium]|nr:hypothetical protein [Rickettsiales bacterium]